jgi:hypothetical protein
MIARKVGRREQMDNEKLSDQEIALLDAIKLVLEVIMTAGIAEPIKFDRLFSFQRDAYLQKHMPVAAVVMEMLRQFAADAKCEPQREKLRRILENARSDAKG